MSRTTQPACAEQLERLQQVGARPAGAVGGGRLVGLGEHLIGHPAAVALEDRQLVALGQAARRHLRVAEVALRAHVLAEEQHPVGPLEIEGVGQRLAHPAVGEHRPAGVEDERLHAGRPLVRELHLLQPALAHRRDVVVERPGLGLVLDAEVEDARLERLAQHRLVAEVVVAHAIEVVLADIDRQVAPPVVLHPLDDDVAAGLELRHPVGTASRAAARAWSARSRGFASSAWAESASGPRSAAARGCRPP